MDMLVAEALAAGLQRHGVEVGEDETGLRPEGQAELHPLVDLGMKGALVQNCCPGLVLQPWF